MHTYIISVHTRGPTGMEKPALRGLFIFQLVGLSPLAGKDLKEPIGVEALSVV